MTARAEALHLHLDDVSNVEVLPELFNGVLVQDNSACAYVQRTVDPVLSVVLDKGLDYVAYVELLRALDVSVDEGVLGTERGVSHDLIKDSDIFVVLLSMLIELMLYHQVAILALHALVHLRQVQDVLGCVLDHVLGERTPLPEGVVVPHHRMDLLLLRVDYIYVLLEEQSQRDVIVIVIRQLLGPVLGLLDDAVSNLGIEHEIADEVVLIDQSRLVLAEVVEDFHDGLRLHDFFETAAEGVHCQKVEKVRLPGEVHLEG